jgi:hypothetical protein
MNGVVLNDDGVGQAMLRSRESKGRQERDSTGLPTYMCATVWLLLYE